MAGMYVGLSVCTIKSLLLLSPPEMSRSGMGLSIWFCCRILARVMIQMTHKVTYIRGIEQNKQDKVGLQTCCSHVKDT